MSFEIPEFTAFGKKGILESLGLETNERIVLVRIPLLGLANRLRVLLSAMLLATKWQSELLVDWRRSSGLNATLDDLFPGAFRQYTASRRVLDSVATTVNATSRIALVRSATNISQSLVILKTHGIRLEDQDIHTLATTGAQVLVLIAEGQFALRSMSCLEYFESKRKIYRQLFERASVRQEYVAVTNFFGNRLIIGLHARVFEKTHDWHVVPPQPSSENQSFAQSWDQVASLDLHLHASLQALQRHPNALIFVASNSPQAKQFLLSRLPRTHAVSLGHNLERDSLAGIRGALLDFMLLAESSLLLHTFGSSFGEEAALGRPALASIRIRKHGHVLGTELTKPFCNHPLFENADYNTKSISDEEDQQQKKCYFDEERSTSSPKSWRHREVCTRPLVRIHCDTVIKTWGVRDVYC
uniref:Uncharacterized protein n=1 Tax=Aureoumbra lagunensis TaxID=44058 RepID=A0A7S3NKB8_9STRA